MRTRQGYLKAVRAAQAFDDPVDLLLSPKHSKGYKSLVKSGLRLWAEFTEDEELAERVNTNRVSKVIASSARGQHTRGPIPEEEYRRFLNQLMKLQGVEPRWMWAGVSA